MFIGGAVVQWLRDGLGLISQSSDVEALAQSVPDSGGVYLVPAFAGPRRAALGSVRARHDRRHHARHDGRAHRPGRPREHRVPGRRPARRDATTPASPLTELRVDGGAAANDALMQFQADLLGVPVVRPEVTETTALGAAYLAGLAVGFWDSTERGAALACGQALRAVHAAAQVGARRAEWGEALSRSKNWIAKGR